MEEEVLELLGREKEKSYSLFEINDALNLKTADELKSLMTLLKRLEKAIGKNEFYKIKCLCYSKYKDGFYVSAKKNEFANSKKGIEYILRYCGRPCFAAYRIIDIADGYITFWYQRC